VNTPLRDSLREMRFTVRTISKRVDYGHIFSRETGRLGTKRLQNGGGIVIFVTWVRAEKEMERGRMKAFRSVFVTF